MAEFIEAIEIVESVEIANIHAIFVHVYEKMAGYRMGQGEYPTLSATEFSIRLARSIEKTALEVE